MEELDHKEGWVLKKWCFWTVVLEKTLESPLDSKESQLVNPKGNQSWIFIRRTDAEAETPIVWSPDEKNWLIWKDPNAGKDRRWKEKETTEDEMVGWHHQLNEHEFEYALGVGDGQEAWSAAVHGITKSWTQLIDWTELNFHSSYFYWIWPLDFRNSFFPPYQCENIGIVMIGIRFLNCMSYIWVSIVATYLNELWIF